MRRIRILAIVALCTSSITPMGIAPAIAQNGSTLAAMDNTCAADLALVPGAATLLHDGTAVFTTDTVVGGSVVGSPAEVPGSRVETANSRFGTGTPTYSDVQIVGAPFRNGGSVNLFGDQVAKNKNWPNSEYDFTADFATVTTWSFNCNVSQATETYFPAVHIPGTPVQGYYINCDFGHGQGNDNGGTCEDVGQPQGSCAAHNATGPSFGQWGRNTEQCKFIKTADAVEAVDEDEYWVTNPNLTPRPDLSTAHTVDETNVAQGTGHEANGGPFTEIGNWLAGKVVVCISPSKVVKGGVPGGWLPHNGYNGGNLVGPAAGCNTPYFKIAPWGGGSQTSNGTYISVPGY